MPRVLALTSGTTTLEDHRLLVGALLGAVESDWPLDRRPGILLAGGDPGRLSGTGMTATIAPLTAVVAGASAPTQGPYLVVETEDTSLTLGDGPAVGTREDIIGLVIRDDAYDASGQVSAEIRVIDPAADFSYLPLYSVDVPQGASAGTGGIPWASAVTDLRTYTSTHGGVIAVPDMAARSRLGAVRSGTLVAVAGTDGVYMRVAAGWVAVAGQPLYDALATVFEPLPGEWVPVPRGPGISGDLRARREGDRVYLQGGLSDASRAWSGAVATLPEGYRPPGSVYWVAAMGGAGGSTVCRVGIATSGAISIANIPGSGLPANLYLDGANWTV